MALPKANAQQLEIQKLRDQLAIARRQGNQAEITRLENAIRKAENPMGSVQAKVVSDALPQNIASTGAQIKSELPAAQPKKPFMPVTAVGGIGTLDQRIANIDRQIAELRAPSSPAEAEAHKAQLAKLQAQKASLEKGQQQIGSVKNLGGAIVNNLADRIASMNPYSNAQSPWSEYSRERARLHAQNAAREGAAAQRGEAIAARGYLRPADEAAATTAAARFTQGVAQTGGQAGAGAAALANMQVVDPSQYYNQFMNRADEQFRQSQAYRQNQEGQQLNATMQDENAEVEDQQYRDAMGQRFNAQQASDPAGGNDGQQGTGDQAREALDGTQLPEGDDDQGQGNAAAQAARVDKALSDLTNVPGVTPEMVTGYRQQLLDVYKIADVPQREAAWQKIATDINRSPGIAAAIASGKVAPIMDLYLTTKEGRQYDENGNNLSSDARLKNIIKVVGKRFI